MLEAITSRRWLCVYALVAVAVSPIVAVLVNAGLDDDGDWRTAAAEFDQAMAKRELSEYGAASRSRANDSYADADSANLRGPTKINAAGHSDSPLATSNRNAKAGHDREAASSTSNGQSMVAASSHNTPTGGRSTRNRRDQSAATTPSKPNATRADGPQVIVSGGAAGSGGGRSQARSRPSSGGGGGGSAGGGGGRGASPSSNAAAPSTLGRLLTDADQSAEAEADQVAGDPTVSSGAESDNGRTSDGPVTYQDQSSRDNTAPQIVGASSSTAPSPETAQGSRAGGPPPPEDEGGDTTVLTHDPAAGEPRRSGTVVMTPGADMLLDDTASGIYAKVIGNTIVISGADVIAFENNATVQILHGYKTIDDVVPAPSPDEAYTVLQPYLGGAWDSAIPANKRLANNGYVVLQMQPGTVDLQLWSRADDRTNPARTFVQWTPTVTSIQDPAASFD